ncbi:hypothetical protein JHK87_016401 [Glycine soja]|nr:hypothetical protein JHK87_016401 [Glycine soja]
MGNNLPSKASKNSSGLRSSSPSRSFRKLRPQRSPLDSPWHSLSCALRHLPNQLPAMLSHVISWLSVDEAVRSSILPKRWKPLWKYASCLDFDVSSVIKPLSQLENSS